jgi:hypothetical protein
LFFIQKNSRIGVIFADAGAGFIPPLRLFLKVFFSGAIYRAPTKTVFHLVKQTS